MRQTIAVITDNTRDQINGVVTTFANIESRAASEGYDIKTIDPSRFPHWPAPGYPEVKLSWPRGMGRMIQDLRPDYVHIATEGPLGLAAKLWLDRKGWRYNTSYHTKFPEFMSSLYGIPQSLTWRYLRWFHSRSTRVLTTTNTMVEDLRAHGFQGDLRAWTRGVDRTLFDPGLRSRTGATKTLLSVGRVSKEKGLDDFCELEIPGTRKILVGDGPYRRELQQRYPDVEFPGALTGRALAQHFADADVLVFTSRADTFGVVIIEALVSGTPVAAYPVPGPRDILTPGVTGYMSNCLQDAVEICLDYDRSLVAQHSQHWSWDRTWEIFRDCLEPTAKPKP